MQTLRQTLHPSTIHRTWRKHSHSSSLVTTSPLEGCRARVWGSARSCKPCCEASWCWGRVSRVWRAFRPSLWLQAQHLVQKRRRWLWKCDTPSQHTKPTGWALYINLKFYSGIKMQCRHEHYLFTSWSESQEGRRRWCFVFSVGFFVPLYKGGR